MKQILQSLKTGGIEVAKVPIPSLAKNHFLIQTRKTLVSSGTEKMLLDFGKASYLQKARQQPDKVRMVVKKLKTDGIRPTLDSVFSKLNEPMPLGYCNVGVVAGIGDGATGLATGDRVISNGKHAEFVTVPNNLIAKIPDNVSDETAAFTVLGAVGMQGIRLVAPTIGETIVVIGLGLIGLLTVQILMANGCRVLGLDYNKDRLKLASEFGAEIVDLGETQDPVAAAVAYSRGRGVDAVVITASSKTNGPIGQAAAMSRKRGRIVLVGVVGLKLSRADFYEKELSFQVSCSYGPGRYDAPYEQMGVDYPVGFVRWTEQRNFEAVLDLMAAGSINVNPLISHKFDIDEAHEVYDLIANSKTTLGVLLNYPENSAPVDSMNRSTILQHSTQLRKTKAASKQVQKVVLGFVGAGQYAKSKLMPEFKKADTILNSVVSQNGVSGHYAQKRFGFHNNLTDSDQLFLNPEINAVVIATRHNTHAELVVKAMESDKNIFIEKPLCITIKELESIECIYNSKVSEKKSPLVMVGFNRRFAPQIVKIKQLLEEVRGPKCFVMMVNAGAVSADHWTQDRQVGGGRVIGEVCHFIDLLRFLSGAPISDAQRLTMSSLTNDNLSVQLAFADGSIGNIHYFSNGDKSIPKERLEVFVNGRVLQLNNYKQLKGYGWNRFSKMNLWQQDKGQNGCVEAFVNAVKNGTGSPIVFEEVVEVARTSILLAKQS